MSKEITITNIHRQSSEMMKFLLEDTDERLEILGNDKVILEFEDEEVKRPLTINGTKGDVQLKLSKVSFRGGLIINSKNKISVFINDCDIDVKFEVNTNTLVKYHIYETRLNGGGYLKNHGVENGDVDHIRISDSEVYGSLEFDTCNIKTLDLKRTSVKGKNSPIWFKGTSILIDECHIETGLFLMDVSSKVCEIKDSYIDELVIDVVKTETFILNSLELGRLDIKKWSPTRSNFKRVRVGKIDLDSCLLMKGEVKKDNNMVETLYFNSKEMSERLKKYRRTEFDYWVLFLNKWSNEFGVNVGRSVLFFIGTSLVFYSTLVLTSGNFSFCDSIECCGDWVKGYLTFSFRPLRGFDELGFIIDYSNPWNPLIDLLGRIFIGYSIYQFIVSFRRFGKV